VKTLASQEQEVTHRFKTGPCYN